MDEENYPTRGAVIVEQDGEEEEEGEVVVTKDNPLDGEPYPPYNMVIDEAFWPNVIVDIRIPRSTESSSSSLSAERSSSAAPSPPGLYLPLDERRNEIRVLRILPDKMFGQ
jgi:hypothetical protein